MSEPYYSDESVTLFHGDCLEVLATLPDASVDAVVTDPPYGLEFMGKGWDAPWQESDVNADAGFNGGGISATRTLPSFTGSTNPKCLRCKGTRRGRRDGTAKVAVCLCADGGEFPNVRAVEMLAFQQWCQLWAAECLRVLKPGGHLLAFGGTRTYHRMACAIEDAGFEIRDSIHWTYGSGFPKSLDVSKAIDKAAGAEREVVGSLRTNVGIQGGNFTTGSLTAEVPITAPATDAARQWDGWGTALKPSHEPIVVARKPLSGTVAATVLEHGTGALNVDGCRVGNGGQLKWAEPRDMGYHGGSDAGAVGATASTLGRWPANTILTHAADCCDTCGPSCPVVEMDRQSGVSVSPPVGSVANTKGGNTIGTFAHEGRPPSPNGHGDTGGASRFFPTFYYTAKASTAERPTGDVMHPTVKPLDLMRWLVRLVTPPGGTVLEPFAGSGTTAEACVVEGFRCIAIEREPDYLPLIVARLTKPIERTLL